jgi:hypothetical protein
VTDAHGREVRQWWPIFVGICCVSFLYFVFRSYSPTVLACYKYVQFLPLFNSLFNFVFMRGKCSYY